jgi:hypothetical protein
MALTFEGCVMCMHPEKTKIAGESKNSVWKLVPREETDAFEENDYLTLT